MKINNTVEKFITSVKQTGKALKKDPAELDSWCQLILDANLPDLPENYEYSHRIRVSGGKIMGEELISQRKFWSNELECWLCDDEKKVMDLPMIPKSHVEINFI